MSSLMRGQKIKLSDISNKTQLQIGLSISTPSSLVLDISCFGVDDKNKLSDDRYFIFYNQKTSPCGSLSSLGTRNGDQEQFQVDLSRLPSTVRKLVFVVTIDGNGVMSQIHDGYLRLLDQNTELARFIFSSADFQDEKTIMVGEIYFKDVWRFSAVGQGFNGGLNALLKYFGGEEITMPKTPIVVKTTANNIWRSRMPPETINSKMDNLLIEVGYRDVLEAATTGDSDAQCYLGMIWWKSDIKGYIKGNNSRHLSVSIDQAIDQALRWYSIAAESAYEGLREDAIRHRDKLRLLLAVESKGPVSN